MFGRSAFQWIHHLEIIIHIDEHSKCLGLLLVFKKVYACTTWMLNYRRNESKLLFIQHICAYLFAKSISFGQYYPPLKRQIAISKCTYTIILHLIILWFNPEFLLEHLINVVIFYDTMMSQNWITNKNKDVCIQLDTQMYQLLRAASDYSIFDEEMMMKFLHSVLISLITWSNSIIYSYFRYWVINCRRR